MHATDLGVGADFVGQLFVHLIEKMPGANIQHRLNALWHRILAGYERHSTESRLDNSTLAMLKYGKPTSPKLKAHAAEVRGLIPIARDLVELLLDDADPIDHTVKMAMVSLSACYDCLSADHPSPNAFKDHSRRFASLFVALEQRTTTFGIRPKLHMFQELCEMTVGSRPAAHWTYRDEDFGGSLVALAKKRGGKQSLKRLAVGHFPNSWRGTRFRGCEQKQATPTPNAGIVEIIPYAGTCSGSSVLGPPFPGFGNIYHAFENMKQS